MAWVCRSGQRQINHQVMHASYDTRRLGSKNAVNCVWKGLSVFDPFTRVGENKLGGRVESAVLCSSGRHGWMHFGHVVHKRDVDDIVHAIYQWRLDRR
jgi:hypothetical protein